MKKIISLGLLLLAVLLPASASADTAGVWNKWDLKVPVYEVKDGPAFRFRATPEFVFTDDAGGLRNTILRGGPNAKFNQWFELTLNGVSSTTGTKQDVRPEVQPELTAKIGKVTLKDRNRLSYRALNNAAGDRWQYANEAKVILNLPHDCSLWTSYEGFVDLSQGKMIRHHVMAGPGFDLNSKWHTDVGYLFRPTLVSDSWVNEHFLFLSISNK